MDSEEADINPNIMKAEGKPIRIVVGNVFEDLVNDVIAPLMARIEKLEEIVYLREGINQVAEGNVKSRGTFSDGWIEDLTNLPDENVLCLAQLKDGYICKGYFEKCCADSDEIFFCTEFVRNPLSEIQKYRRGAEPQTIKEINEHFL